MSGWDRYWLSAMALIWMTGCSRPATPPPPEIVAKQLDLSQARLLQDARQQVVVTPQSADAWGRLGQLFDAVDFHRDAIVCYAHAEKLDGRSARWPYLRGLLQLQDEPKAGLAALERAVSLADVEPDAPRLRLAQALVERGAWDEAHPHLRRLLEADPFHPAARLERARIQLGRQSLDEAAETLAPCLTNGYTARPAQLLLSQIRQRQGRLEEAATMAARASAMPRQFDWPDPYAREVLRLRVDRQALLDAINGQLISGRLAEAESALNQLLRAFPNDVEGLLLLGRLRFQERRCAEAEAALRRHLGLQPQSVNGLIQLALAMLCQQRWNEAAGALREAIVLKPDFAQAHYNLGYALGRAGDTAGAMASWTNALRCNPGYVDAHVALAEECFRAGDTVVAREHLRRALELEPKHPKAGTLRERHP